MQNLGLMKKFIIVIFIVFHSTLCFSQYKSPYGYDITGQYIMLYSKYSMIAEDFAFYLGFRSMWIINDVLGVGSSVYILLNDIRAKVPGKNFATNMDYGGVNVEYIFNPGNRIFFTAGGLVGGGTFSYNVRQVQRIPIEADPFLIFEPELNAIYMFDKNFGVSFGTSFRIITGVDVTGIGDADLNKLVINVTFVIGKFTYKGNFF
jgi:hypothetical protein